ncbi:hypothetical protein HPB49_026538 [Dermacentor silvarum]|nr:hypothetical protein HPB49_026538 [Dermacentor silvarum]
MFCLMSRSASSGRAAAYRRRTVARSQGSDFSDDGDAVIARFCALIDERPENSEAQLPGGGEEEDALSSVSEATAVAAALPSDLRSRIADVRRENAALQNQLHSQPRPALQDDFPALSGESKLGPDFPARAAGASVLGGRSVSPTSVSPGALPYAATTTRDFLRLLKKNIDPGAKHIKDISLLHTRYGLTVFSNNNNRLTICRHAIKDNSVTRASRLVRLGQKRNPHVKFNGVDPDIAPDEFLRVLNERNEGLDLDLEKCKVRVTFRERAGTSAFVAEVDPEVFKRIMKRPPPDLHVPTCTYCATYRHGRMTCPHKDDPAKATCMKVRMGDDAVCCTECKKLGHATTHPTCLPSCSVLLEKVARLRARTNYGA